ncbi:thioredoxin family protein [Clostridium sp. 'deep sea']|uniref:thioredoxin family protein n=1 Tax=Clostridium sp. 'deep sea' TaxID=2779445 RepID=UPI0018966AA4|nr:thioredoxin family protein [Clostridium sp. 'deep sea']QOR34278.1 thioredoxin family protein [Clostridium sp. 'deep sea']
MKQVTMFMLKNCPHCQRAIKIMDQLMLKEEFKNIEIKMIDEQKHSDIADRYDYYYVPTYYIDDKKVHEGVPTKEKLQLVLEQAIASE